LEQRYGSTSYDDLSCLRDHCRDDRGLAELPDALPEVGIGAKATLDVMAPSVLGGACRLDARTAFKFLNDRLPPWTEELAASISRRQQLSKRTSGGGADGLLSAIS
jgi:hypothetical protein